VSESKSQVKPFEISKWMVWEAYQRVKANKGAAGVDEVTVERYEQDLNNNLFKLWNRMSSGSYFPPPVKAVEIPKAGGRGVRIHCGRSDRPDGGGDGVRACGGTGVPPGLLRLPSGAVGVGRGGSMPGAVLAGRLGCRS
jgi:hypothetical protein